MPILGKALRALASGGIGGAANVALLVLIWKYHGGPHYSHAFLYKQVTWGGIWGLGFIIPIFPRNWWLRGMLWGTAATAVALLVFKVVPITPINVAIGLVVNAGAWGLVASGLYQASSR